MAASFRNSAPTSLALFLILLFQMADPSIAVDDQELTKICSSTSDPNFCMQALKSDPATPRADHRGLTQIAINLASGFARQTLEAIKSLRDQPGGPPRASLSYAMCTMYYRAAIDKDLAAATEALKRGDFNGVSKQARLTKVEGFLCEDAFSSKPSPTVVEYNNKLSSYCGIIIAVA